MPDVRTRDGAVSLSGSADGGDSLNVISMGKSNMGLQRKLKTALDETRVLILGAQVLFDFQFNGAFRELFGELPRSSRHLHCVALVLIDRSAYRTFNPARVAEEGQDTNASLDPATFFCWRGAPAIGIGTEPGCLHYVAALHKDGTRTQRDRQLGVPCFCSVRGVYQPNRVEALRRLS
jgi:hypothetical protein